MTLWLADIEPFEAINQDELTRGVVLRMAWLTREGGLEPFLSELSCDPELDEHTKGVAAELASNETFLLAVEDYIRRTRLLH